MKWLAYVYSYLHQTENSLCTPSTGEMFVIDILQEEKYIYGGEWNKTWLSDLFVQSNNLSCLLEWN